MVDDGLIATVESILILYQPVFFSLSRATSAGRYGGKVLFLMKMGPAVSDASTVLCKPAYGGNVYLYYSLDGGDVWETLSILETFSYRTEEFTEV